MVSTIIRFREFIGFGNLLLLFISSSDRSTVALDLLWRRLNWVRSKRFSPLGLCLYRPVQVIAPTQSRWQYSTFITSQSCDNIQERKIDRGWKKSMKSFGINWNQLKPTFIFLQKNKYQKFSYLSKKLNPKFPCPNIKISNFSFKQKNS